MSPINVTGSEGARLWVSDDGGQSYLIVPGVQGHARSEGSLTERQTEAWEGKRKALGHADVPSIALGALGNPQMEAWEMIIDAARELTELTFRLVTKEQVHWSRSAQTDTVAVSAAGLVTFAGVTPNFGAGQTRFAVAMSLEIDTQDNVFAFRDVGVAPVATPRPTLDGVGGALTQVPDHASWPWRRPRTTRIRTPSLRGRIRRGSRASPATTCRPREIAFSPSPCTRASCRRTRSPSRRSNDQPAGRGWDDHRGSCRRYDPGLTPDSRPASIPSPPQGEQPVSNHTNAQSIAAILARVEDPTVTVAGHILCLRPPTRDEVIEQTAFLAGVQIEAKADEDGGGDEMERTKARIRHNMSLAVRAVMICVPGVEAEVDAFGLMQAGGGAVGELAQTCMALSGFGGGLGGAADDDPFRSSSPENSESP